MDIHLSFPLVNALLLIAATFALVFVTKIVVARLRVSVLAKPSQWLTLVGKLLWAFLPVLTLALAIGGAFLPFVFPEMHAGPKLFVGILAGLVAVFGYDAIKGPVEKLLGFKLPDKLPKPEDVT